jgi:hypothetical protein
MPRNAPTAAEAQMWAEEARRRRLFEHRFNPIERLAKLALERRRHLRELVAELQGQFSPAAINAELDLIEDPALRVELKACFERADDLDFEQWHLQAEVEHFELIRFCRAKNRPDLALVLAVDLGALIMEGAIRKEHGATWQRGERFTPGRKAGARGPVAKAVMRVLRRTPEKRAAEVLRELGWPTYGDTVDGPKSITKRTFENTVSAIKGELRKKK